MLRTALLGFVATIGFAATAALAWTDDFTGVWEGDARDSQSGDFPIWITIYLDGSGEVAYESYDCEGTLTLIETNGGVRTYRETITKGTGNCVDGGSVELESDGDTMRYFWSGSGITATGTLEGTRIDAMPSTCAECQKQFDYESVFCSLDDLDDGPGDVKYDACMSAANQTKASCTANLCSVK